MSFVYLDNSATTKPCKQSIDALNQTLIEDWGNPSSLHTLGIKAEKMMNEARQKTAKLMGCMEKEVYFTSVSYTHLDVYKRQSDNMDFISSFNIA